MPNPSLPELLRLGPFRSIATSPTPYVEPGVGVSGLSANPYRISYTLTAERGRVTLATLTAGGIGSTVATVASYVPNPTDEQIVGATLKAGAYSRFMYDPSSGTQTLLNFGSVTDSTYFDTAVQFGGVIYDNAGRQYSAANPDNTYLWQYPAPDAGTQGFAVAPVAGGLGAGTYSYAFTQVVTAPNNGFSQETTATGGLVDDTGAFPFSVTLNAAGGVQLSGTFAGTNPDGSTYVTNVYRQSTDQPAWHLLTTLTANAPYTDTAASPTIAGGVQLVTQRDAPPVSPTNLGAIMLHKERMWAFVVVQNADTNNLPQTQLWFSNLGRPWEFDAVNSVLLVGNSATPLNLTSYTGTYGDYPTSAESLGSVGVLWKSQSLWALYGDDPDTFLPRKIGNVGTRARRSVAVAVAGQATLAAFLAEIGVCVTDGYTVTYISEEIRTVIEGLSLSDRINAVGVFAHNAYYISFPQLGQTWGYYWPEQKWFGPLPYATTAAFSVAANPSSWGNTASVNEVTAIRASAGGASTTSIDQWFAGGDLDLGAPQSATWEGPLSDSGAAFAEKEYRYVSVMAPLQPGVTALVKLAIDPGCSPAKTYTWECDLSKGPIQIKEIPPDFRGFIAQLSVTLTTLVGNTNAPAVLYSVSVGGTVGRAWLAQGN